MTLLSNSNGDKLLVAVFVYVV